MGGKVIQFYQLDKGQSILNIIKTFVTSGKPCKMKALNVLVFRTNIVTVLYQRNASTSPSLVDTLPLQPVG